jgi:hypothetical protein
MFRPSPPTSLSLSLGFLLRHVAMPSSADGFTATTASSATPRHFARRLRSAWSVSWRSSTADDADGSSPGKNIPSVAPQLPSLHRRLTERISDFGNRGYLIRRRCLSKVRFRLAGSFDSGFLQIPHWTMFCRSPGLSGQQARLSSDTLAFVYVFPPFTVTTGLSPARKCPCWAHPLGPVGLRATSHTGIPLW